MLSFLILSLCACAYIISHWFDLPSTFSIIPSWIYELHRKEMIPYQESEYSPSSQFFIFSANSLLWPSRETTTAFHLVNPSFGVKIQFSERPRSLPFLLCSCPDRYLLSVSPINSSPWGLDVPLSVQDTSVIYLPALVVTTTHLTNLLVSSCFSLRQFQQVHLTLNSGCQSQRCVLDL